MRTFLEHKSFQKYLSNSVWLLSDFFLRMVVGVFVVFYVARYLGPEKFGVFSYLLAISTFMIAISRLGMEAVLVREIIKKPENELKVMGTAFWMMFLSGLLLYILVICSFFLTLGSGQEDLYLLVLGASSIFTSFYVVEFYFQSQVKAKYATICRSIVLILMSVFKLFLIYREAELFWFFVAGLMDNAILALVFLFSFWRMSKYQMFFRFFCWKEAKNMLASAWPMVLVAIALQAYMRTDQIMIRNMLGAYEVGIYSAAIRISEAWIIMMGAVAVSLLPAIIKLKAGNAVTYRNRMVQLFRLIFWSSVFVAVGVLFFGEQLIILVFGKSYLESASIISLMMWSAVFSSMGSVASRYFNVEGMEKKFALRTVLAALVNAMLNYFLIPIYGIQGAAFATLFSTFFANYFLDWFDKDLRVLLQLKHRAVFGYPLIRH